MRRRTPLRPIEEVLNCQSKNALAQNDMLKQIDHKVYYVTAEVQTLKKTLTPLEQMYQDMVSQVQLLDRELRTMIQANQFGSDFTVKEQEIQRLQKELDWIHQEKHAKQ
jgi:predicted RNase H-like nuclease (RuvC/YqgF family)